MKKYILALWLFLYSIISIAQEAKSDFSHIEIIVDSADFQKLNSNSFIRDSLGVCRYDTMQTLPLVISYYILGQENFLHFNPNKGYFATQLGSAYIIFQSRKSGQGKLLEQSLKSVSRDSVISYDIKNPDFTLTEIIFKNHSNLHKINNNNLIPMLSSYSVETYKKWELGDSVDVSMKEFIGGDSSSAKKYFTKILSVKLSITKDELDKLGSVLQVAGYERKQDKFVKEGQPELSFSVNNKMEAFKIKEIKILLNEDLGSRILNFGNVLLMLEKNKGKFLFK
jgi:hypothetical protein